jgi:bacterioferritin (cytochrome b1)
MSQQFREVNQLLRCQLDAVHQQFIHILTLRAWDDGDTASRIAEVDNADFRNAMRIIDYLVEREASIDLSGALVSPGRTRTCMLEAERAMEQRMAEAIECGADVVTGRAADLFAMAQEPRPAYRAWLEEESTAPLPRRVPQMEFCPGVHALLGQLLTAIEQPMIHAFVHRSAGAARLADAAWAGSGAAMMRVAKLIQIFSVQSAVPVPDSIPAPEIKHDSREALDADRRLAQRCAEHAAEAQSIVRNGDIDVFCRELEKHFADLARWVPGLIHPTAGRNPPSFDCFEATFEKFVRSGSAESDLADGRD